MKQKTIQLPGVRVTPDVEVRLNRLCKKVGVRSIYQLLVYTIDCYVRYMDGNLQLDEDLRSVIDLYERFSGWGRTATLIDMDKAEVQEAIYWLKDSRKEGLIACSVRQPFFSTPVVTYNKQYILDTILSRLFPDLNRMLKELGMQFDTNSSVETMKMCVRQCMTDADDEEIRKMFSDCNRHEFGRDIEYKKYKRTRTKKEKEDGQPLFFSNTEQETDE